MSTRARWPVVDRPYDVAVVGAGPAGGSLALRLARTGMRVVLIDRATFPRAKLCGEYLSPEAWGVLDRLGLAEELAGSGYQPIRRVRLTTPSGRRLETDVVGPDGRPGLGLSRSALDATIVRRARAAGVAVLEGTRVGGPLVRDGRVVGLRARHPALGAIAIGARVTVAADGRHSALVRQTGSTRPIGRSWTRRVGLQRHLTVADPDAAEPAEMVGLHLIHGGYGGACRVEGGLTNVCALLPESALRRHRGDLDGAVRAAFGRNPVLGRLWEAATPSGDWKAVAGVRVEVSAPRFEGILYAGDCRGTVDPLGGQGMTMALLGGELLVPFVERALAAGRGIDVPLQRAYETAWDRRFGRRVRLCRLFHHVLVNPALVDLASTFRRLAPRLLAGGYRLTRDPEWVAS